MRANRNPDVRRVCRVLYTMGGGRTTISDAFQPIDRHPTKSLLIPKTGAECSMAVSQLS